MSNTHILFGTLTLDNDLVSWGTFHSFWSKSYSNLVIRHPNSDICVDCYIYANVFKLGLKKKDDSDDDTSEDEAPACPLPQGAEIFNTEERETQILAAAEHVKLARVQQQLFNSYIAKAKEDATDKVLDSERTYMQIENYWRLLPEDGDALLSSQAARRHLQHVSAHHWLLWTS
jgi:hypothetical protein